MPNVTVLPVSLDKSIILALLVTSSSSDILPSVKDCLSFAAWYSAFSFKSPCSLATEIALIIAGRSSFFNFINSDFILSNPNIVKGILSILIIPILKISYIIKKKIIQNMIELILH